MAFRSDGDMKAGDKVTLSQAGIRAGVLRVRQARGKVRGDVLRVNTRRNRLTIQVEGMKRPESFAPQHWQRDEA
jgi:hypothetical protein